MRVFGGFRRRCAHPTAARRLHSKPTGMETEATERMSGLVDGWSRREARGHGIALLAALLVSRIVTGKLQLSLRPVEIGSLVTAAIGTVTPAANAKSVLIQLIRDPAGSAVMGDRNRLQQVFWNLLSNAVKLSEERPGPGERSVRRLAGRGRGLRHRPRHRRDIPASRVQPLQPERLLEHPLRARPGPRHREAAGRAARRQHPGREPRGWPGLHVHGRLPRSPVTAQPAHGRVDSQADRSVGLDDAPDLTGIRVLIVEDDDDARTLVPEVLQGQGAPVDVVASTRTEDRLRARRAGFQMHLPKPVQPAERITVVASLATRHD